MQASQKRHFIYAKLREFRISVGNCLQCEEVFLLSINNEVAKKTMLNFDGTLLLILASSRVHPSYIHVSS